mmetsp:Transcript_39985/g.76678  ORF Transcript_39985/g.76678 Transcript_39985/m.76678 type:complete len:446 (+) Transcript_39985:83-1420(+)
MADVSYAQNSYFERELTALSSTSQPNRGDTSRYAVLPEAAEGMDLDGADDWDDNEQSGRGEVPFGATAPCECKRDEVPATFTMALPEGVSAGERLICSAPDGQKLRLTIPPGVLAGSSMNLSRDATSGKWMCVIDALDESHEQPTYQAFHSSSTSAPIAFAVPPLHRSTEHLLRISLQAAGFARPLQVHLSALHTPAGSYGPSPCGSYVPSPGGSMPASPAGSYVPAPWPHHSAPPIVAASARAATGRSTLGLAPARAAPRVVTSGWGSNASSRQTSPASTPRAHIRMGPSQSYTPPPVMPPPVIAKSGLSSSCIVAMPGASQPQRSFSRNNTTPMQPRYPAAAPAAVAVHQQQRRASWTQGQFQASRLSLPTKTPQELQHNTKSWFPVARQQQQQQQQQRRQEQQKQQQLLLHHQQFRPRAPANRLSVKPVTQRRQRRSVCCAI